ncbi:SGNH/GDSL hydrolase family protein [Pontiella sulfatireligans]|uniref:Cellulase/esterase CelE n=1 Tax=Pontiella sulfatireligans TaxID=2750658 RepID=A0A6C2UJ78_9BACT|nr:SGNH/GDSL hydrolase family protein [Pontiella sulfatireligans]VGO19256.1 Cellulase/esterase CelE [Pontiella sulfatireligans]
MKRLSLFAVAWLLVASAWSAQIAPDHPTIRYVGRFTEDHRFGWTGSTIEVDFQGSELFAELELADGAAAGMTVVVDGEPRFLKVSKGRNSYKLADGLDAGTHRITLFKRSEGAIGTVRFHGFDISDEGKLLRPETPRMRMLVIGDSITCGYGNEAKTLDEGNTVENENGYMSYAPIAARELGADIMMFCWSGRGIFRNRQLKYDQATTIPKIFDQTLPLDANIKWDHTRFVPDVVVINLGTNDMAEQNGKKEPLPKEGYIAVYKQFITRIRSYAPESKVIISIGPMGDEPVSEWLPEIAGAFDDVSVLVYAPFAGADDTGGHHHPSVKKDKAMAAELVVAVESMLKGNN